MPAEGRSTGIRRRSSGVQGTGERKTHVYRLLGTAGSGLLGGGPGQGGYLDPEGIAVVEGCVAIAAGSRGCVMRKG